MKSLLRTAAWMIPAAAMVAAPAMADAVRLAAIETAEGARIEARWADGRDGAPPAVSANVEAGVLRLRFSEPVEVDVSNLQNAAPRTISFAQADEGGRDVRIALRRELDAQVGVSGGARIVQLGPLGAPMSLQPQLQAETPPPETPRTNAAQLAVGLREDFTRLSIRWPQATTVLPRQNGAQLELRFSRAADLDIAELRAAPPRFVREARLVSREGQPVRLLLTLDPGVRQRHFVDGNYTVVDLLAPTDPPPNTQSAQTETERAEAPYVAPRGPSAFRVIEEANATRIQAEFPTAARAAAFRRGDAIWILFESGGRIDL
ncbi:MAG: hypothetical protein AB7O04_14340, partial [Hyphomonadaceae bacterium]